MSYIVVTALSCLDDAIREHEPSRVITILSPENAIPIPEGFTPETHLRLGMSVTTPPTENHVASLLAFARSWDAKKPLLVHCKAGKSRSMSAAFIVLCDRAGPNREQEVAAGMRERAAYAATFPELVALGDSALKRDGRMPAAFETLGEPGWIEEGVTTVLPLPR